MPGLTGTLFEDVDDLEVFATAAETLSLVYLVALTLVVGVPRLTGLLMDDALLGLGYMTPYELVVV